MKVLRIDPQGVVTNAVFNNLEDLRLQLANFHSLDWQEGIEPTDPDYVDIYSLTLDELIDHGEWRYKWISEEDAEGYLEEQNKLYEEGE